MSGSLQMKRMEAMYRPAQAGSYKSRMMRQAGISSFLLQTNRAMKKAVCPTKS